MEKYATLSLMKDSEHLPDGGQKSGSIDRRTFLISTAAGLSGVKNVLGGEILQEKGDGRPIEVVREGKEGHIDAVVRIHDREGKRLDASKPLPPGTYKLYTGSTKPGYLVEARYEVVDMNGKLVEKFPKTHVPVQDIFLEKGQRLRVVQLPAIFVAEQPFMTQRTFSGQGANEKGNTVMLERLRDIEGHHFGIVVEAKHIESGKTFRLTDEEAAHSLPPGTYDVQGRHSRFGFPQFFTFVVAKANDAKVISEQSHSTRHPARLVLERDEKLLVRIPPAVRPYNSSFFTVGVKNPAEAAVIFPRPYPSMEFAPGMFHGREEFNSVEISLAFWGMKKSLEDPKLADKIRAEGVATLRPGVPCKNAELVLGARVIAEDLAKTFCAGRKDHGEDYRGSHHASFLHHRGPGGRLHPELLAMPEADVAALLEKHLIWMVEHNVHRVNEGGGYADKAFRDVFGVEGKEKARQWPEVSRQSTELYRKHYKTAQDAADRTVEVTTERNREGKEKITLDTTKGRLLAAIHREKLNYANYPPDWLKEVEGKLGKNIADRQKELDALGKALLK